MFHVTDEYLFNINGIKKINIHKNVIKLDSRVFYNHKELKTVYFEKNSKLSVISEGCFENCIKLESISLPSNITTIKRNAFKGCISIKELIIPSDILLIEEDAFHGWKEDQKIYTPITINKPITCKAQIIKINKDDLNDKEVIRIKKEEINYYIVKVKCGHVGRDKYMPISFPVIATDKKDAVAKVRNFSRVKRDHKDFVIDIKIVDEIEYYDQIKINKNDPYLKIYRKSDQNDIEHLIKDRLVDEPNYIQKTNKRQIKD